MPQLPALSRTGSTKFIHIFSRLLILGFFVIVVVLLFAPWRQFVKGTGRVIAFDPLERWVNVEALVSGRVKQLHVVEGQRVKAGDRLAEIQDNDPNLLENLRMNRLAAQSQIEFARSRVEALTTQMAQQELAKVQALDSARERVVAAEIAKKTAELEFNRASSLFEKGLASRREYEQAILKRDSTAADLRSSEASLKRTENDFAAIIASILASLNSAKSDIASAERGLRTLDIGLSQNERQLVTAPRDGFVLSVPVTDGSYLSPGTLICVIIPETESRFVEIWVDGNDVALIKARSEQDGEVSPGSTVRLSFEGWPAIQAMGWPQLAIGTFNGEVIVVDSTDNGKGQFRVVVMPKEDMVDRGDGKGPVAVGWPSGERWLRQSVQAKGWVLLEEVPLWFELWRQINGFPPIGKGINAATISTMR